MVFLIAGIIIVLAVGLLLFSIFGNPFYIWLLIIGLLTLIILQSMGVKFNLFK